ncbi:MAG: hypothetical protein L6461_13830 [Anaerolineae bacterium]|nr:hypothetical protein [Anaerolineae bacterium]
MSITAKLRITSDKVIVEIPDKNLYLEKPNVTFYDSQSDFLLGVGEYREKIEKDTLEREKSIPENLRFGVSFQYDDEAAGFFDPMVIEYYLALLYYSKQPFPIPIRTVDFDFQIETYSRWSEKRRLKFEYDLQSHLHARLIKINGTEKETPIWKRRTEKVVRFLFVTVIPLGVLYFLVEKSNSIAGLLGAFLVAGLSFFINIAIWIFMTRQILPTSYSQFIFESLRPGSLAQKITKFMLSFQRQE